MNTHTPKHSNTQTLIVNIPTQTLSLYSNSKLIKQFPVSTAAKGAGEQQGSEQTPRGKHIIRAKIGKGAPIMSVFVGRRPTGEIYSQNLADQYPERDWILTRILWLSGCEIGVNRLGDVDTMRRYIYIHGTNEENLIGKSCSHGCIRMNNNDIIRLYDIVNVNSLVEIQS